MARVQNCPEITILTSQLSPGQGQVELGERGGWVIGEVAVVRVVGVVGVITCQGPVVSNSTWQ